MSEFISWIWSFFLNNYIPFISIYLAGGVVYAVCKWIFLLFKLRTKVMNINEEAIARYRRGAPAIESDDEAKKRLREIASNSIFNSRTYPPLISENKTRFMGWAIFWPINLIWTLIADVAEQFFLWIYYKWNNFLQYLSNTIVPK